MKSWAEISRVRLTGNLRAIQAITNQDAGVEVLGVVKANAYGHDAAIVAPVLVEAGVRWLGVADVEEGARVREASGDAVSILVMCGLEPADAATVIQQRMTPVIWTAEHVAMLERVAEAAGQIVPVHLEIDTGMARQGVQAEQVASVAERLAASKWVRCEGVMSHLVAAEVEGSAVTKKQREKLVAALEIIVRSGIAVKWLHLGATSAVDEGSTLGWMQTLASGIGARVMMRPGLALYGYCLPLNTGRAGALHGLIKPVLTWKTRVIGLRTIHAGDTVGYGATFTAESSMTLALLPVGYADGFRRAASSGVGNGWVMIGNKPAAVVGRVSMNLMVVNVTDLDDVAIGDEVVLLGDDVTAEDHARWSQTIPYEILCGIRTKFER